jgi:hypothetical protein
MAFALEQFLAAFHLGVASILDLEPRCPVEVCATTAWAGMGREEQEEGEE